MPTSGLPPHATIVNGPTSKETVSTRLWPSEGYTRAPYWVYTDHDIYAQEHVKLVRAKTWNYVGLEAEVLALKVRRTESLSATPSTCIATVF